MEAFLQVKYLCKNGCSGKALFEMEKKLGSITTTDIYKQIDRFLLNTTGYCNVDYNILVQNLKESNRIFVEIKRDNEFVIQIHKGNRIKVVLTGVFLPITLVASSSDESPEKNCVNEKEAGQETVENGINSRNHEGNSISLEESRKKDSLRWIT